MSVDARGLKIRHRTVATPRHASVMQRFFIIFILDLSFNPEITDELMVIYFDLNKEIFCITHES